jgi:hypothetical protein
MSLQAVAANPFMLLVNPEVVFAAVEKSERLNGLNRHLCRPLDRVMPGSPEATDAAANAYNVTAETELLDADSNNTNNNTNTTNDSADLIDGVTDSSSPFKSA